MTTVLIDMDRGFIIADKQGTQNWGILEYTGYSADNKIRKIPDGYVTGAGDANIIDAFAMKLNNGRTPDYIKSGEPTTVAVLREVGGEWMLDIYENSNKKFSWLDLLLSEGEYRWYWKRTVGKKITGAVSFGSGGDYIWGAYKTCDDPIKAMEVTCKIDKHSGLGYDIVWFKGDKQCYTQ